LERGPRGRPAEFRATQPFEATDKLRILLDATERALSSPTKMGEETFKNLGTDVMEVQFIQEDNVQPDIVYSAASVNAVTRPAHELDNSVERIRVLVENDEEAF
jgi:hypothetical protein